MKTTEWNKKHLLELLNNEDIHVLDYTEQNTKETFSLNSLTDVQNKYIMRS